MKTQKSTKYFLLLNTILMVFLSSCAGGRITMTANNLEHPVSTTEGLYDPDFKLIGAEDYQKVGDFELSLSRWSLLWTIIPLSGDPDISEELNNIIKEKGGDAIVNLQVTSSGAVGSIPNFFAAIVPIIPGVVIADITGDVVKIKK